MAGGAMAGGAMPDDQPTNTRPPSVDALARSLAKSSSLPHAVLVECARRAVRDAPADSLRSAREHLRDITTALFTDVVNATGVLLHTNLGRAPLAFAHSGRAVNLEFDLATGRRGSRQEVLSHLVSMATGAEAAIVVNNNAAAVLLVLSALAHGRDVAVSRGESVEIGGGFRIPEVMEQSGARLIDVGTTNKTRLKDYSRAIESPKNDVALVMKIHPSNYSVQGFTESTSVTDLAGLNVPVVVDIGSGLLDNTCPWLNGRSKGVSGWLANEPAATQTLNDGAALVTFSGDKLMGGPQCGIIAGRRDLVEACHRHPLMRALRPGTATMLMLQEVLLSFLARTACDTIPFWTMVATPLTDLHSRARDIAARVPSRLGVGCVPMDSIVGAGSAPDGRIESAGLAIPGDVRAHLRAHSVPVIARATEGTTFVDLRTVAPRDDDLIVDSLAALPG